MSFLRSLIPLRSSTLACTSSIENSILNKTQRNVGNGLLKRVSLTLNADARRGIKTTDTVHPEPVYNEDEKILNKVLDERLSNCEDLPIGIANPYEKPKKKCILCEHGVTPNYKNIKLLYQFVSPYTGLTYERHITGLCKKKHDQVVREILIANNLGMMSNYLKLVEFLKDPKLCDPERPVKPHKY